MPAKKKQKNDVTSILEWAELIDAREFATKKHADQLYGEHPYTYHLNAVCEVAQRHCLNGDICVAAWLHDILEDTSVSSVELRTFFGPSVAGLVEAVTDEPGKNRLERAKKTWPKIRTDAAAVALKLCDRIANVQACLDGVGNVKMLKAYRKEYDAFRAALYRDDEEEMLPLWLELDELILAE